MFGLCCVAVSLLLCVICSSRLYNLRPFIFFQYIHTCVVLTFRAHPRTLSPRALSLLPFLFFFFLVLLIFLRVFLFSLSRWRVEGTAQVIGPLEAKFCDLTSSFISSFQPHGGVSGGLGGSARSNFLRT